MYIVHGFWHNMFGIELFGIRGLSDDEVMAAEVEVLAVYLLEQLSVGPQCMNIGQV